MDPSCRFATQYQPSGKGVDPIVELHVRNCEDCQGEVFILRGGHAAS